MATIELRSVSHAYSAGSYAVKDVNLRWQDGSASALLGPSGCGKTTLLKIISGLLKPTEGTVLIDGEDVTDLAPRERNVAQVFQFPVVYETLSVFDNLAFPLRNRKVPESQVRQRVNEVAEMLELSGYLKRKAAGLGAAEQQRIAMGRGLVRFSTTAMLFDEPLTVIDPYQKSLLRRKLKELHRRLGLTMIYVTHDQQEALTFAEQVTVMSTGKVLQTGTPKELHRAPQAPFVGYFIGSPGMNLFEATSEGRLLHVGNLHISIGEALGNDGTARVQVGIRPEFVDVSQVGGPNSFPCEVMAVTLTGTARIIELQGAGLSFKARVAEDAPFATGDTVHTSFPPQHLMVYVDESAVDIRPVVEA